MKYKIILFAITLLSLSITASAQTPLATYYLDNDGNDSIGTNDLTLNNVTFTNDVEGVAKRAAHFNGTNSYAQIPSAIFSTTPTELRVSLWFKTKSNKAQGLAFAGKETVGNYVSNYTPILYIDSFGKLNTFIYDGTVVPVKSTASVTDNKWHHAMVVYSINSGTGAVTQSLFLDGQSVASKSGTLGGGVLSFANIYLGACYPRGIGAVPNNWIYFDGDIDDVNIYNAVLSVGTWSSFMFKLTSMPANQAVSAGDSVKFTVDYTNFLNETYTFMWKKNGVKVDSGSNVLSIKNVKASDVGSYTLEVTNPYGKALTSQVAVLSITSGIADVNKGLNYSVYPNPVTNFLQVSSGNKAPIIIKDITGKEVSRGFSNEMISVANLSSGTYIIQLTANNQTYSTKFIKQ